MRVHCCQLDIAWENKRANYARVRAMLETSRPEAGSLVVLPEMFATGFSMNVAGIAEPAAGETSSFLAETAREMGIYVVGGLVTRAADGRGLNQSVAFDPAGREIARYTKLYPFTPGGESAHYTAGSQPITFPCGPFTAAPFICYDLRFPEAFRHTAVADAHLILVIASWPVAREHHWATLLRARAIENQAYVVGVNRCGADPSFAYPGRSLIVNPNGDLLADAGKMEGMISAELDVDALSRYRRDLPFLADRRKEPGPRLRNPP